MFVFRLEISLISYNLHRLFSFRYFTMPSSCSTWSHILLWLEPKYFGFYLFDSQRKMDLLGADSKFTEPLQFVIRPRLYPFKALLAQRFRLSATYRKSSKTHPFLYLFDTVSNIFSYPTPRSFCPKELPLNLLIFFNKHQYFSWPP